MEQTLVETWQERFGSLTSLPRQWVDRFANPPQDVDGCITECEKRVSELKEKLEQETFLLSWLQSLKEDKSTNDQDKLPETPITGLEIKTTETDSPVCLRRRAFDHVSVRDVLVAQRVSLKIKQSDKHRSVSNIDALDFTGVSDHQPLGRQRSLSDSLVQRSQVIPAEDRQSPVTPLMNRLSPIPDTDIDQAPAPEQQHSTSQVTAIQDINSSNSSLMEVPESNIKRLSNGIHGSKESLSDDDSSDLLASVKTVISSGPSHSPNCLHIDGTLADEEGTSSWMECSGTLKRGLVFQNSQDGGEKTPTGSLDTSVDAMEKGLTLNMINEARTCSLDEGLNLKEAGLLYQEEEEEDDEEDKDSDLDESEPLPNEDSGSVNELEGSGYHTYSNLAESTLTYILRDTIFASRSNSVSSLSGPDAFSPELTPSHEVNLRSNAKRKRTTQDRNRTAQVLRDFGSNDDITNDDITDEERLQKMLADLQDSAPSSPSSELSSGPASPTHLVPYVKPVSVDDLLSVSCIIPELSVIF